MKKKKRKQKRTSLWSFWCTRCHRMTLTLWVAFSCLPLHVTFATKHTTIFTYCSTLKREWLQATHAITKVCKKKRNIQQAIQSLSLTVCTKDINYHNACIHKHTICTSMLKTKWRNNATCTQITVLKEEEKEKKKSEEKYVLGVCATPSFVLKYILQTLIIT